MKGVLCLRSQCHYGNKSFVLEKQQLSQDGICHQRQMSQDSNCPRKAIVPERHLSQKGKCLKKAKVIRVIWDKGKWDSGNNQ